MWRSSSQRCSSSRARCGSASSSQSRSENTMTGLALLAGALVGIAIALIGRALTLPRLHAAEQVDRIAEYGFGGVTARPAAAERESLLTVLGTAIAKRIGRDRVRAVRAELLAAGL